MNTLLAILKVTDARRDDTLAGGLYNRFPWRHLPALDVTLPRAIQPLTSDVLRVLFFLAHFTISVFDYTDWQCFEVKDEEDLPLDKTVRGYKTGRGKRQSK